jgi:hypothetical protein
MSDLLTRDLAERQIAAILSQLEKDTRATVERIGLTSIDITGLTSIRTELQMRVEIDLFRAPGHRWGQ